MTNEIMVSTDLLKKSVSNVRAQHTKEDIAQMANSIKHRGIINPPTVALNGDGKYEIIAGQLRVAGAISAGVDEVRCLDVSALTNSERVALSLSENYDRAPMGEIELFKAFAQLFKSGVSVDQIAEQFSLTPESVQRTLAIGTLPKKILDDAEKGDIGDRTLRALAVASGKNVARYNKLKKDDRPNDWQINDWLYEKGKYPASAAIFDLEKYTGGKIRDLFAEDDEEYLTDGDQFWELQTEAINAEIAKLEELGWKVQQVDYFQQYAYDKVAKKDGGQVIYTVSERTGNVEFHKGYARKKSAGKAPEATNPEEQGKKIEKPATSKAFDDFMAETRHAAVQQYMVMADATTGLTGTLMLLLKQADNIQFRPGGKNLSDAYNDSLHSSDAFINIHDRYTEMLECLGVKDGWTWDVKFPALAEKLDEYKPAQIRDWIILTVAYNWACENVENTDELGRALGLNEVSTWEADDAFWNGITNKKTLIAIAKETGVSIDVNATAKVIRAILKEKVPSDWRPEWLIF